MTNLFFTAVLFCNPARIFPFGPASQEDISRALREAGFKKDLGSLIWKSTEAGYRCEAAIHPVLPLEALRSPEIRFGHILDRALATPRIYPCAQSRFIDVFEEAIKANIYALGLIGCLGLGETLLIRDRNQSTLDQIPKILVSLTGVSGQFLYHLDHLHTAHYRDPQRARFLADQLIHGELTADNIAERQAADARQVALVHT